MSAPSPSAAPAALPIQRACELAETAEAPQWLIEELWAQEAVGILGGEPKCCKSFLALDIAVSVASGAPCLRRFPVRGTGPVLLFPAEDSTRVVRQRLEGICAAASVDFEALPLYVITAPRLLLDSPEDRERLHQTMAALRPALLVLDPFIRLHRGDENASKEIAPMLGYLRDLQREFHSAVLLVHHVRKGAAKLRPGQALRGSSDLHGWGDSNLYLRRHKEQLQLSIEQRAAPASEDLSLKLVTHGSALALSVAGPLAQSTPQPPSPSRRVLQALAQTDHPLRARQLRKLCAMRTATLCETLSELTEQGRLGRGRQGYYLTGTHPPAVSFPSTLIGGVGNGNGKPQGIPPPPELPLFGETQAGSAGTQPAQG